MPVLTEAAPPKRHRPWTVGVVLLPLLLLLPGVLLFSPWGIRLGSGYIKAVVASQAPPPSQGYRRLRITTQRIPWGSRVYLATASRPIPIEFHWYGFGPCLVTLLWIDVSNATRTVPASP